MSVSLSQFSSFNKSAYFQLQCHHIQSDIYHLLVVVFEILPTELERDFFFFLVYTITSLDRTVLLYWQKFC